MPRKSKDVMSEYIEEVVQQVVNAVAPEASQINPRQTPFSFKPQTRNEHGLLEGVSYVFNEDGTVNWRKMIPVEFIVPNSERANGETDISKLRDDQLIILLGGIKHLAKIRGYTSAIPFIHTASEHYVAASCTIQWVGNYETQGLPVTRAALADASQTNTDGIASSYLASIAENRAFVRAVRNFLNINIVSKEELKTTNVIETTQSVELQNESDPLATLQGLMNMAGVDFEKVKSRLVKDGVDGADKFESIADIPTPKVFELIDRIDAKLQVKKQA
jgi:hypothetical protein